MGRSGHEWSDQGLEAWAQHGIEEHDDRVAADRAERGLATQTGDGAAEDRSAEDETISVRSRAG